MIAIAANNRHAVSCVHQLTSTPTIDYGAYFHNYCLNLLLLNVERCVSMVIVAGRRRLLLPPTIRDMMRLCPSTIIAIDTHNILFGHPELIVGGVSTIIIDYYCLNLIIMYIVEWRSIDVHCWRPLTFGIVANHRCPMFVSTNCHRHPQYTIFGHLQRLLGVFP